MHHICKGVIFYLSSFASHCESLWKLVIQNLHYILTCGPLRKKTDAVPLFKYFSSNKLIFTSCNTRTAKIYPFRDCTDN